MLLCYSFVAKKNQVFMDAVPGSLYFLVKMFAAVFEAGWCVAVLQFIAEVCFPLGLRVRLQVLMEAGFIF